MNTKHITNYKPKDFAELVQDIISILHVFSCRIYELRKYKRKYKRR